MSSQCINHQNALTHPKKVGQPKETERSTGKGERKRRRIAALTALLITVSMLASASYAAERASVYSTSLSFQYYYCGPARSYTGSSTSEDIHWKGTTQTLNQTDSMSTTFTISLYRERKWLPDELIGHVTCSREGYHNIVWTNVGAGRYYFCYSKDNDGATVYSNAVILSMS